MNSNKLALELISLLNFLLQILTILVFYIAKICLDPENNIPNSHISLIWQNSGPLAQIYGGMSFCAY